jgi:hypothetical protein
MTALKVAAIVVEGSVAALGIVIGTAIAYAASLAVEAWLAARNAVLGLS